AMPDGGQLTITAGYDPPTGLLAVGFRDTGSGIASEEIEKIFRPVVTTKTKGTGLGLPNVQKIIDNPGGDIDVQSKVGEGTCFVLFLPLDPPSEGLDVAFDETPIISPRPAGPFPDK